MNRIVWKDNLREIKESWPRFFSIFAIILLGVAFFVGIKVASPSMIETATSYFNEYNLSDGRVVSTQGITQEDVDAMNEIEGIHAIGMRTLDTRFYPGSESIRIFPYNSEETNFYKVIEGRLPEAEGEIALDSMMPAQNPDWKIGSTIELQQVDAIDSEDLPDDMEAPQFKDLEYTVVGFVDTPYYYERFTRGMKMDGKGDLAAFGVVLDDDIIGNLNTEAYWWLDERSDSYSDEYTRRTDEFEDQLEEVLNERSRERFNELQGDFRQEILDAQDEIDEGYQKIDDAQEELDEARQSLDDGWEEYEEGQEELADAQAELADARRQLDDGWAQANQGQAELADSRRLLQDKQAEYDQGWSDYQAGLAEYQAKEADALKDLKQAEEDLASGRQTIQEKEKELDQGWKEYHDGKSTYDQKVKELEKQLSAQGASGLKGLDDIQAWISGQKAQLESGKKELASKEKELEDGIKTIKDQLGQAQAGLETIDKEIPAGQEKIKESQAKLKEVQAALPELESQLAQVQAGMDQLNAGIQALEGQKAGLDSDADDYEAQVNQINQEIAGLQGQVDDLAGKRVPLQEKVSELQGAQAQLEAGIKEGQTKIQEAQAKKEELQAGIKTGQAKLEELESTGHSELEAAKKKLQAAEKEANEKLPALQEGLGQLQSADQELSAAKSKLESGDRELAQAKDELSSGQEKIDAGYQELQDAKDKLTTAQAELADAKVQLDDGWAQLSQGEADLANAFATLQEKEADFAQGQADYQEGLQELADAKRELDEGEEEYKEASEEFEKEKKDALQELEEAQEELDDAEERLDELEKSQFYLTGRDRYIGYETVHDNADKLKTISNVFPVLFFLIAIMVTYMTITRMAQEQRNYMGTMQQMGYTTRTILWKFIFYAGSASLLGALLGVVVGYAVFPPVIMNAYNTLHYFDHPIIVTNHALNVVAVIIAVACAIIPAVITPISLMQTAPANLLLPPPPKAGDSIFLERWPWFWDRLSLTGKMTLRNLSRYKGRALLTILGVGGCMVLIVTGFGISDSVSSMVDTQFDYYQSYDYIAVLEEDVTREEALERVDLVEDKFDLADIAGIHSENVDASVSGRPQQQTQVMVPISREDAFERLVNIDLVDEGGLVTDLDQSGPVITEGLISYYDLEEGDTLTLEDEDFHQTEVTVDAIAQNNLSHYLYLSPEDYRMVFKQEPLLNTVLMQVSDETDRAALEDWFGEQDWVLSIVNVQSIRKSAEEPLKSLDMITLVLIVSAASLAFVVLYNLLNINISERLRELSTIKVLGFYSMEVTRYIFDEIFILTAFGSVVGAVGGVWLNRYILKAMSMDDVLFHPVVDWPSFIYAIVLTYLFVFIIMWVMNKKIRDIDMVEALKAVD